MLLKLESSASAIADVNGNATVRIYAPGIVVSWKIKRMVSNVSGAGATPQSVINLAVYRNSVSETNRVDGTSSAAQDTSETDIELQSTDSLIGVYSTAPAGSVCTLNVTGTKDTGR